MITPVFEINQSDISITLIVNAPFANVSMLVYEMISSRSCSAIYVLEPETDLSIIIKEY